MSRRRQRIGGINVLVQVAVLVAAVVLIGLLAYRQVQRVLDKNRPVVVARGPISPGTELTPENITVIEAPVERVPPSALKALDEAMGRVLQIGKGAGHAITENDFHVRSTTPATQLSNLIPEGRVLTTLTLKNITVPHKDLLQGDRIDILAHGGATGRKASPARLVVEDAYVVGYLSVGGGAQRPAGRTLMGVSLQAPLPSKSAKGQRGLLLALYPDDVLPLAEVDGSGEHINLVLHSRQSVEAGEMLSVSRPSDTHNTVDVILGAKREKVTVQ